MVITPFEQTAQTRRHLLLCISEPLRSYQYIRAHDLSHLPRLLEHGTVSGVPERAEALHWSSEQLEVGLGQRVGYRVVVDAVKELDGYVEPGHFRRQNGGQLRVP